MSKGLKGWSDYEVENGACKAPENSPRPTIIIGQFTISPFQKDSLWVNKPDGEGFAISIKKAERFLSRFFDWYM